MTRLPCCVRRVALALLAALLAAGVGSAVNAQSLVIGAPDYVAGTPLGELAERMMAELAQRSGIGITLKSLPPMRAIEMANGGLLDGEVARIAQIAARYPHLRPLTTPFSTFRLVAYAGTPDILTRTRAEIRRLRIGVMRGVFLAGESTKGLVVVEAGSLDALFELLHAGRIDVMVGEQLTLASHLRAHPQISAYRWPHEWAAEPLRTLIHEKHAALMPRLNAAAQQMQHDGVVDRLNDAVLASVRAEPLRPEPPAR